MNQFVKWPKSTQRFVIFPYFDQLFLIYDTTKEAFGQIKNAYHLKYLHFSNFDHEKKHLRAEGNEAVNYTPLHLVSLFIIC